ncbi:MAG: single-stranded DNA-binding protein [Candidatus Eisenbacteria bacterium]|nr:single-stranded DNA-binding protein [Candidatus Eisenbacteria bacterium]
MTELKLPEVNRVMLSGRLTRDPDRRYAPDGTPVTSFTIAFHRRYRGRDGKMAEQTGYVTIVAYQRLAEVCGQYLKQGSAVLVEGRLQVREWNAPQGGEAQKRLEIRGESVHFLERSLESNPPAVPREDE